MTRRHSLSLAVLLAVALAGLTATLAGDAPAGGDPGLAASSAARGPIVGRVTSRSGANLWVKPRRGGGIAALDRGDRVHLGDVIVAGPGAGSEIELSIPRGVTDDDTLLFLHKRLPAGRPTAAAVVADIGILMPIVRTKPTLRLARRGELIEATLRP